MGAPWDVGLSIGTTLVPLGGGGGKFLSGQIWNIDLNDPSCPLVFGGLWTNAYGNVSVPATCPAVELDLQLVALDVTSPDGVRVSQVVGLK